MRWAACVVLMLLLAGCSQSNDGSTQGAPGSPSEPTGKEPLAGFVADGEVRPIVGASVSIPSVGATATTDDKGRYAFGDLPMDTTMTVITEAEGYVPSSKSIALVPGSRMHLNFTLAPVPIKQPDLVVESFNGVINCNGIVRASGDRHEIPCGLVAQGAGVDQRIWQFPVRPDLAGLVVEVFWTPRSDLARDLNLTIETAGYGDADKIIYSAEGRSILRGQIGAFDARRYYTGGGDVRVTVDIGRNTADEEVDIGAGIAFQQDFQVYASMFYVAPPPPAYTIDTD